MAEDVVNHPPCRCHGVPKTKAGRCRIKERARQARLYADPEYAERKRRRAREIHDRGYGEVRRARAEDRKARGLCIVCEQPLLSESLCWDCLNKLEARRAFRL